jgi:hypothetical protein
MEAFSMTDAVAFDALRAEVALMRTDLDRYGQGLMALAAALQANTERLTELTEAVQREPGPSPIEDLLRQIVTHLQEQAPVLQQIAAAVVPTPNGAGRPHP